jgi:hypothetical protein
MGSAAYLHIAQRWLNEGRSREICQHRKKEGGAKTGFARLPHKQNKRAGWRIKDHLTALIQCLTPNASFKPRSQLSDVFFITLCAIICGTDNWVAIEAYGKAKKEWFVGVLNLKHGIPSHDTMGKVFAAIDHEFFSEFGAKFGSGGENIQDWSQNQTTISWLE